MSYYLEYVKDGARLKKTFNSYYECVKEKNCLAKQGYKVKLVDYVKQLNTPIIVAKKDLKTVELTPRGRVRVKEFLEMCSTFKRTHKKKLNDYDPPQDEMTINCIKKDIQGF